MVSFSLSRNRYVYRWLYYVRDDIVNFVVIDIALWSEDGISSEIILGVRISVFFWVFWGCWFSVYLRSICIS